MSLTSVTQNLNEKLSEVDGLRVAETLAPGTPPDSALAILELDTVTFDGTFGRGSDDLTFDLLVLVPTSSPRTQLATLEGILTAIKAVVEELPLPLRVQQAAGFSTYSINGVEMYGCHVVISVTAVA